MSTSQTRQTLQITLKYEGPDVDDGTMSLEDIVPVLQGFASAYGKVASKRGYAGQHRLRITNVRRGSADILLEVWETLGNISNQLTSIQILGTVAITVVGGI